MALLLPYEFIMRYYREKVKEKNCNENSDLRRDTFILLGDKGLTDMKHLFSMRIGNWYTM